MMTRDDYQALQQQLLSHEGLRLKAYRDTVGKITIGVGRNLTDVGISMPEAMLLFEHDLAAVIGGVTAAYPWVGDLDIPAQRVLYDIAFNCGIEGLGRFHRLLAALQGGDRATAATEVINSALAPARAQRLARLLRGQETT